jgi:hypothetical protein
MSVVHRSGTIIHAQGYNISYDCLTGSVAPDTLWVVDNLVNPDDPALDVAGSLVAGTTITFTVHAQPGSHAVLRMGRGLALAPTPGIDIEQLVQANRNFDLGIVPASGQVTKVIPLPATVTPGLLFAAQAEVTGTNGLRRTNSVPVIVR